MLSDSGTRVLAVAVLAAVGLAMFLAAARTYRRTQYTLPQFFLFLVNTVLTRVLWRAKISGPLPIAPGQGAVIVSNHMGPVDPLFIALGIRRTLRWMIAKEYFQMPVMQWIFRTVGAIPVSRGGIDTAATKLAIRYAQSGDVVGLFPEGRINDTGRFLLPGRPGAALIALKARVPVIPCYITGSPYDGTPFGCLLMTAKAHVTVGRPIDLSSYYDRNGGKDVQLELTKLFLQEIARLAGVANYEPELAGRRWKPEE